MDTTNSGIVLFSGFEKLKEEIKRLKTELSMLLLERDELELVTCKNIEVAYHLKFGALEYKAYEAQCTALRLKRKIELIQARLNRQEKVELLIIEQTLDTEFADYKKILNEKIDKMNEAIEYSKLDELSPQDSKELKKLYRNIVKHLHPDINPDVTNEQLRLLETAITAYKDGNIATLKIINAMLSDYDISENTQDAMSALTEEKSRLEDMLLNIRKSIDKIKSSYPYTVKELVTDSEKEQQYKEKLESILKQYEMMIKIYQAKLKEMLG